MSPRQIAILLATGFAILTPVVRAVGDIGISQAAFARAGDETLRAAGYAFSIWSLIYLGLAAYAVWQALPRNRESRLLATVGWPSALAIAGCGVWIWASAADARWLTVVIILVSAAAMTLGAVRAARRREGGWKEGLLAMWPLGLLAGWLTIASALNILSVLTAEGLIGAATSEAWAVGGILAVTPVGLAVLAISRLAAFGVPIAWGFAAVAVAERTDQPSIALLAAFAAAVVTVATLWAGWRGARALRPAR